VTRQNRDAIRRTHRPMTENPNCTPNTLRDERIQPMTQQIN